MTPNQVASALRHILKDYNFWSASESDSPLKVKTTKSILDESKLKSLDASLRRRAYTGDAPFRVPVQTVRSIPLCVLFRPLIDVAFDNLAASHFDFESGSSNLNSLELATENFEYLVQLYAAFDRLDKPHAWEVSAENEATVTLVIAGQVDSDNELRTVFVISTLVRT